MNRVLIKICDIISYILSITFIFKLHDKFVLVLNSINSARFRQKTKCRDWVFIPYPSYIIGHKYIQHKRFTSRPGLRIECIDSYLEHKFEPTLIIGNNVSFNFRCHIGVVNRIIIGDNVLIGSNVLITDHSHGYNDRRDIDELANNRYLYSKGSVIIEDNVWIGENVCILPNVIIGKNSIIGANSVVTKNIPPNSIAVGNPIKIIKRIDSMFK